MTQLLPTIILGQLVEQLPRWEDNVRFVYLTALLAMCSPPTTSALVQFQDGWDKTRPYTCYRVAQDQLILECIDMECHILFGTKIRKHFGLLPLTTETWITPTNKHES
jgi:hypothetical protein